MIWKSFRTSQLEYLITLGCLLIAVHNGLAAPVYDSTEIDTIDSNSCYYNYNHYYEGDRILTNEPCLNCTCHNRMLMCYLRVCPFTKPIGQDCVVERREDQCCPIITCPEVPVELLNHHTTSNPITAVGGLEKYGCSIEGEFYPEGAQVPSNPRKPCELCYCIRNMTACVMQECTLHVDGCQPIYNKGVCCPVRYNCEHDQESEILMIDDETTTTERPTPGFMITTTAIPGAITECIHDTNLYSDGEMINTDDPCQHCYCMKGDMVCAVQECGTPLENKGKNCTAKPRKEGQCCPDMYECEMPETTTSVDSIDRVTEKSEATTYQPQLYTEHGDMEEIKVTTFSPESMITDSGIDEKVTPREDIQLPSRLGDETDDEKDKDGKLRTTTTSGMFDKDVSATTSTSDVVDDEYKPDSPTTIATGEPLEIATHAGKEELPEATTSAGIQEPVTDYQEQTTSDAAVPTEKVMPVNLDKPIDSSTVQHIKPKPTDDVTTEINDRFGSDEGTTQKSYEVPIPDLSDHELQQHIDDDNVFTKTPPQSDDDDKLIELTTQLYTDIGTTLSSRPLEDNEKLDSEEDNTVKPYDSTTIESNDKYPGDAVTTPASSVMPTTQADVDENITDSKLKIPSVNEEEPTLISTTQQSIEDLTSTADVTVDGSKTDKPQVVQSSTLQPSEDITTSGDIDDTKTDTPHVVPSSTLQPLDEETESTTPLHVVSTENKTFKMEDAVPTEKYDDLFASFVPGEGSCLLGGVTYANNSIMPPIDVCQLSCTCINSNIICDNSRCDTSPQIGVLCDADGKCGEDLATPTEGSAQGSDDEELAAPPHEGSAQGEIPCAGGNCDETELAKPTVATDILTPDQNEIVCTGDKCSETKISTPDQEKLDTPPRFGSESTTPVQDEISCADGKCDGAVTLTQDDDAETPAPGLIPDISAPVLIDAPESTTSAKLPALCANGICDGSESETTAPTLVVDLATPAQSEIACAGGKCDESEPQTPAPEFVPEYSTPAQVDISESATPAQGEITCDDGKCDGSEPQTPAPGFDQESATPVPEDITESVTQSQDNLTCANGKCDGSESETPAPGFIPEFSTPVQGDISESATPVQGVITCASGKCDGSESETPAPGVVPELTIPTRGDVLESVTPAQPDTLCVDGKCDGSESQTLAPGFVLEFTTPAQSDILAQGEITCADGKCDDSELATPLPGFVSVPTEDSVSEPEQEKTECASGNCDEATTLAQGVVSEPTTPEQGKISCANGKCEEPELISPAQEEVLCIEGQCGESKPQVPAPSDGAESSTPVQGNELEIITPTRTSETACSDGKCDEPLPIKPSQGDVSETPLPAEADEIVSSTTSQVPCTNGQCEGTDFVTPAQSELPCADGKCDQPELVTPPQIVCTDGKCDEPETILPAQGDITCADGKCDQEDIIKPPTKVTQQLCENSPDGKCSIEHQIAPTQQSITDDDDDVYLTTPVPKVSPLEGVGCSDGKCDGGELLPQGVPDLTQLSCTDGKCDEPVTSLQGEDLVLPTQATPPQDITCTSGSCMDTLLDNLNKTSEPISVIQVVTVLPEIQTTPIADKTGSTQSDQDDYQEQTDKDTIITRIQVLPTTTESGLDVEKVTDSEIKEPTQQPDTPLEDNVTDKITDPFVELPIDESEIGHKTDINKPSTQVQVDEKPTEQEPTETSTLSDKDVSEMITSLPIDVVPKIETKPTEKLPTEDQNEVIESDTTQKPLDAISPTTAASVKPVLDISDKPSDIDDLELDTNLRTTFKPIDEPTQDGVTYPSIPVEPTNETSIPTESIPSDLEKPVSTTVQPPTDDDNLSDKTDSPLVQIEVQTNAAPVEKVTDISEFADDQNISTVGSVDNIPSRIDVKPETVQEPSDDKEVPSTITTILPEKEQPSETTVKPSEPLVTKTTTVKYTELDNNIEIVMPTDKLDDSFTEKQSPKDDVTESSTPVKEEPRPTIIAPIHDEEPQNQMGVTDQYDETSGTTLPSKKPETDRDDTTLENVLSTTVQAQQEKKPSTPESFDDKPTTVVPTTVPIKVIAGVTDVPSRIDSDDNEIIPTTASAPEKPIDGEYKTPIDKTDKPLDVTTLSSETSPIQEATEKPNLDESATSKPDTSDDSYKPILMDAQDVDVTTTSVPTEPTKGATDKFSPIDNADIDDLDVTKPTPIQEATDKIPLLFETTSSKDTTDRPSPVGDSETTAKQEVTDQPISVDESTPIKSESTTPSQYATDKPSSETTPNALGTEKTPFDDKDDTESDIITAGPIDDITEKPSDKDDEKTTPSKDSTDKPAQVDGTETTPSQQTTDKIIDDNFKESDIITAGPTDDSTDKPSSMVDNETTLSKDATDEPISIDDEDKESDIITASPIDESATTKLVPTELDDTTPSKDGTDKPKPIEVGETTPSQEATEKPSPIEGGETTPSQAATEKAGQVEGDDEESEVTTAGLKFDATDKPSSPTESETATQQGETVKPSSMDDDQTTPTKDATDKPTTADISQTTPIHDDTDETSPLNVKEPEIITANPDDEGIDEPRPTDTLPSADTTDKPSSLDDVPTIPASDSTDKPSSVDHDQTTPIPEGIEKNTPVDTSVKEPEIITSVPTDSRTDKPSPIDDDESTESQEATDKPSPMDGDQTTQTSKDGADKPSSIDDEQTTSSDAATGKPSPIDVGETTPSHDATDRPSPIDEEQTTPSKDGTEKPRPIDDEQAIPSEDATDKPSPIDDDKSTTPSQDITGKPNQMDEEPSTPSQTATNEPIPIDSDESTSSSDVTAKPSSMDEEQTTVSKDGLKTEKPIAMDVEETPSSEDATDKPSSTDGDYSTPSSDITEKPSPVDDDESVPSFDTTDKPSPIDKESTTVDAEKLSPIDDDDKESEIITAAPIDKTTVKPTQAEDEQTTTSQDATDKPSPIDIAQSKPSKDTTEQPISTEDDKESEIITASPTDDDITGTPSTLEDGEKPTSQKTTDKPTMDITTVLSKVDSRFPETIDDSDKEMDVTTVEGTTSSKDITEKPSPIDDSGVDTTTPPKGSLDTSATTLPSATDKPSEEIDDSKKITTVTDSESTTVKIIKPTPIESETTPSEFSAEITDKPDSMAAITTPSKDITDKTTSVDDFDKEISATTTIADLMPTKGVTDELSPMDDMDKESVTTKTVTLTPNEPSESLTDKPSPAYDVDDKDIIATTSFTPSDSKTTPINDTKSPSDKPSKIDDIDKDVSVSTTVSAVTTAHLDEKDDLDVVTAIATKLGEEKPQSSTEITDQNITDATDVPSKETQEITDKPDKVDDTDKEVAGSTPSQEQEVATDKPIPIEDSKKVTTMKYEEITDKTADSEEDKPVTIKPISTTVSQDQEITVTEIPSRLDSSDINVTVPQSTPDEALIDELFTKPTEVVKTPQDGYDYQKPPQDKFDYTKQPTETTVKPESQYSPTISHPLFTTQAPSAMETPGYGGHLPPQPPQYAGNYPDEEYGEDEDPASFGPGTCRYGGKIYVSAQQIPRDDPCDFCFCFRSDIICLQQSCPPPITGCNEEPISGFCCPRYNCHVKMATVLNVTTSTTTTTTTLPPHFMHHAYKGAAKRSGCQIKGQAYQVGDIISSQSGPCMRCICGGDGQMQCEPKVCSPEPMLQQMIAVAAANRRRR